MSIIEEQVSKRIMQLIGEHGWSIYRLSQECTAARNSVYNAAQGKTSTEVDTLAKICDTLGVTMKQFFDYEENADIHLSKAERIDVLNKRKLDKATQQRLSAYIQGLADAKDAADNKK